MAVSGSMLLRLKALVGLDVHIFATILFRGWGILAGGLSIVLIPLFLSPTQQGFYYTFASILALQVFFELGLNQVIIQFVSHEFAYLTIQSDGKVRGDPQRIFRLNELIMFLRCWYAFAAVLFFLLAGGAGAVFFCLKGGELNVEHWGPTWFTLVLVTSFNLFLSHSLTVIEGTGQVGAVARLRLLQSMVGYGMMWILLLLGLGLWAAVAVPTAGAVLTSLWLRRRGNIFPHSTNEKITGFEPISWYRNIFPLQWRIAISWATGYLIFNLFTPVVFSRYGSFEAGRLGLALTVFSSISVIGMSWVYAKAPVFTMYIARGERRKLNSLFKTLFTRSILVTTVLCTVFVASSWFLNNLGFSIMLRIADLNILAVLSVVTIVNSMIFSMAVYMRAHREEPMLIQSIVGGLLVSFSVYVGSIHSVLTMVILYMCIVIFILLPWTICLYLKYINRSETNLV